MPLARAHLESLLRARQLDRTLTTALPPIDPRDDSALAPSSITPLDARLGGGFPRGQLSELIGARSSGRTSVVLQMMAAATARGELVALVDALDMLDVESAASAGVALPQLLWVRGHVVMNPGLCRDLNQRAMEQAIRALTLVLQAGNFGLVVFDAAEAPADAVRRLPFTTWMRLQRIIEGSQTACVLVGGEPMARSSAGLTLRLSGGRGQGLGISSEQGLGVSRDQGAGSSRDQAVGIRHGAANRFRNLLFDGLDFEARIVRARARERERDDASVALSTSA
jgi:recombination protein RecA